MPFLAIFLFKFQEESAYVFFAVLGLLAFIPSMMLTFDTTMQSLDKDHISEEIINKDELLTG